MAGIISVLQWIVTNWHLIATVSSLAANVALFFMHGTNAAAVQELRDFVNSIQVTQTPVDPGSAQSELRNLIPKA